MHLTSKLRILKDSYTEKYAGHSRQIFLKLIAFNVVQIVDIAEVAELKNTTYELGRLCFISILDFSSELKE